MKKKIFSLALVLALIVASFGGFFGHEADAAAKKPKRGFVAATTTYAGSGHKSTSRGVDFFLSKNDANVYAAKLNSSYKSTIGWGSAAFIPGVGKLISVAGIANDLASKKAAKQILALTKKGKKVHIFISNGIIGVKAWDGKASSIKTSMPKNQKRKHGNVVTKITTKVTKKVVKY